VVQLRDQFGNVVLTSTAPIAARISSGGGGSLGGVTTANANGSTGSGTFANLSYNLGNPRANESVVIYFTSPGLTSVTNSALTVDFVFAQITLTNGNSMVQIDPTTAQGMFSWIVDGTNQVYQHWFWLRQGSNAPQTSFDQLGEPVGVSYTSTNANLQYLPPGLSISMAFALSGGAPGSFASDFVESVRIQNTSNGPVTLHVFDYADFDLAGNSDGDTVTFPTTNSVLQQGKGMKLTQTAQGPTPSYWEASWYAIALDEIDGSLPATLSDKLIPPSPGDQTFAYQWDVTLNPGQSFAVILTNSVRPGLIPIGSLGIAFQGGNVILSWPTNSGTGAKLQTTSAVGAAANWIAVTNLPVAVNGQYQVSVPPIGGAQFYRLKK
jgi:hypothetical protein